MPREPNQGTLLRVSVGEDVAAGTWREVKAEPVKSNYQRFAEAVNAGVTTGEAMEPSFRHAAKLQRILDLALIAGRDRNDHQI